MPQKPLPSADNRFSKENYRAEDVGIVELQDGKLSKCATVRCCELYRRTFVDHSL
jgi:hypothetical protein